MTPDPRPVPSVADSPTIHVQREPAAEPFWQVAGVVALIFIAATVAITIGGPVLLMLKFWSPWLLFLLVFVAFGAWLLVRSVAAVRNTVWRARHRSSFALREAGIETTEWNVVGAASPVRRVIRTEVVTSAVASYRILRRVVLTENGGGTLTETAPVLHVLFEQDGRRRITSIPFASHEYPAIDTWITQLRKRGVELRYTARLLSWKEEDHLGDEARLEYFATTEETIPFPVAGGWRENEIRLENRWHEHIEQLQQQAEQREPALRGARPKPAVHHWILGAWFAGMYAWGTGFLLPHLVQSGTLPAALWPLELLVVLPAAALFFLPLRRGLRWYHGLVCWLLLMVVSFSVVVGTAETGPAAEQVALIGFGLTVLSAALLWVPYLLVKRSAPSGSPTSRTGAR